MVVVIIIQNKICIGGNTISYVFGIKKDKIFMENKTGNVHVTQAKKLVFKAMFYGMVVQIMSKMLRRFFCW
jgi:hypothetical protein